MVILILLIILKTVGLSAMEGPHSIIVIRKGIAGDLHEAQPAFSKVKLDSDWHQHFENLTEQKTIATIKNPQPLQMEDVIVLMKSSVKELLSKIPSYTILDYGDALAKDYKGKDWKNPDDRPIESDPVHGELLKGGVKRSIEMVDAAYQYFTPDYFPKWKRLGYWLVGALTVEILDPAKFIMNFPHTAKLIFTVEVDSYVDQQKLGYFNLEVKEQYYSKDHYPFSKKNLFKEILKFTKRYQETEVDYYDSAA